jgi:hypothetical protein
MFLYIYAGILLLFLLILLPDGEKRNKFSIFTPTYTGWTIRGQSSSPGKVKPCSGVHTNSYIMDTGGSFGGRRLKRQER